MTEGELRYTTVIWDFHGVFTNNKAREAHALNLALRQVLGRSITRGEYINLSTRPEGVSGADRLREMLKDRFSSEKVDHTVRAFRVGRDQIYIPKHTQMVEKIRALGATCVVVTNGQELVVRSLLDRWAVAPHLEEVYGRGEGSKFMAADIPEKPAPQVLDYVIKDLRQRGINVRRDKTLMVGDFRDDVGASNSAGAHSAFLITGPNQLPEYYDFRPTYALLDRHGLQPSSEWLKLENTHYFNDLPKIVSGDI